jgi:hypothetical protein
MTLEEFDLLENKDEVAILVGDKTLFGKVCEIDRIRNKVSVEVYLENFQWYDYSQIHFMNLKMNKEELKDFNNLKGKKRVGDIMSDRGRFVISNNRLINSLSNIINLRRKI